MSNKEGQKTWTWLKEKKISKAGSLVLCTYYLNRLVNAEPVNIKMAKMQMQSAQQVRIKSTSPNPPYCHGQVLCCFTAFVYELQLAGGAVGVVLNCNFMGELINGSHRLDGMFGFDLNQLHRDYFGGIRTNNK